MIDPNDKSPFGCKCQTLHHKIAGDGCDICNPEKAYEFTAEQFEEFKRLSEEYDNA